MATVEVAKVLPANSVPVVTVLVLKSPMFLIVMVADTKELWLANVAVNLARLLVELVAVVTAALELVSSSSPERPVSAAPGASPVLHYWEYPIYAGSGTGDLQYVWVWDAYGTRHTLRSGRDNSATWIERQLDLSAFAGQTVTVWFSVHNDSNPADVAEWFIDDVSVLVCE